MAIEKQLRYIEISARNPITRIKIGGCGEACVNIVRSGQGKCAPQKEYCCDNPCCDQPLQPMCDCNSATVCALEIDDDGYAVFEWGNLYNELTEGWYDGIVTIDNCNVCGVLPVRVGPRCNVLEVEKVIVGPDSLCKVPCEDEGCEEEICPTRKVNDNKNVYIPSYTI